ncbi:beta-defensin 105-like [Rousettus aegyptiacus]|uniref:beta-defensin 105-like n=1 Tax=Rousettus aegyptiacus TaxID=9407 RepID=UPI000787E718|nr:beta-defensin 105-like [Rousettus aegyptiacus]
MAPGGKKLCFVFIFFFILAQFPSGCQAGLEHSEPFPGGEFATCDTCRLGRGRCRRTCWETETMAGSCKPNFVCCRRRI